ncbi:MAG: aconitase family protein [Bacteroidales bacterium]
MLAEFLGDSTSGMVWADEGASYERVLDIDLGEIFPLVAAPHHVDNVKAVSEVQGLEVHQGVIGTCTNGRIEDLREAAKVLDGKRLRMGSSF